MGIYITISNTLGKTIFQIKESSYDKPKDLMGVLEAATHGEGLLIRTDDNIAKALVEHFSAHVNATPKTAKEFGIRAERPETVNLQLKDMIEYWRWGLSQLKKALREHERVVLSVG